MVSAVIECFIVCCTIVLLKSKYDDQITTQIIYIITF